MLQKILTFFQNRRSTFSLERTVCRLIAAWCSFAAVNLFTWQGEFSSLSFGQGTSFGRVIGLTAVFFLVYSGLNLLLNAFETDTWALFVAATVCVAGWLLTYDQGNGFLFVLAVIVVYSLFVIYCIRKNESLLQKWQPGKRTVWGFAIGAGVVCAVVIGGITCYRYLTFSSPNFDFGLFVNMFHNMKETGRPLCTSERDVLLSHFAVHISPTYYLLLPFYMLFPSPLTLQIGQAVVLGSGVIPTVLLCRQFKLSGKATLLVTLIYALYPALSSGCFYDIHENCFLTPLLLWTFYFFEREKYVSMYLFALLTLGVKEDAAVYVMLFALFVLLSRRKLLHGSILLLSSLAYFGIALAILKAAGSHYAQLYAESSPNPAIAGPMINRFDNLIFDREEGLLGAVKTALANPGYLLTQLFTTRQNGWEKLAYFLQMMLPLGFLPFCTRKVSRWLLVVPILMNLLTQYIYQYDVGFQYHFGIIAFFMYATIMNLPELHAPTRKTILSLAATACCCLYLFSVIPVFTRYHERYATGKETYARMEEILDTIPEDASVCCSSFLLAHLADRDEIYELRYHGGEGNVDYVVLDIRYGIEYEQISAYLRQGYTVLEEHENLILVLVKGKAQAPTE